MNEEQAPKVNARTWRTPAVLGGVLCGLLTVIAVLIFQDNIARFVIKPREPFQTVTPPAAPAYDARGAWALWPARLDAGGADIFYVHSTTYYSAAGWNGPLDDSEAKRILDTVAIPNEIGPFVGEGALYAPLYRQATLFSFFTNKYDGVAARRFAFDDVNAAFGAFLEQSNHPERPIVLVGYGQGGLHVLGLLRERIARDPVLRRRLAAAYVIGHAVPAGYFDAAAPATAHNDDPSGPMRICNGPDDDRCVIAFVDYESHFENEMRRQRRRTMSWDADGVLAANAAAPICVNPLSWRQGETYHAPDAHLGAASATGLRLGQRPPPTPKAFGARCDRGILVVDQPAEDYLRRKRWFAEKWKAQDYNLFYYDLTADVARRIASTQRKLTAEADILKPIDSAVEFGSSPVNKVPD